MSGSALSPVDALRVIRSVMRDKSIKHAQRGVIVGIILRADNRTGCAWADWRSLRREYGFAFSTVGKALKAGTGKFIEPTGRVGKDGAHEYRVIPVSDNGLGGAPKNEAQGQARKNSRAPACEAPAFHSVVAGAPESEAKLALSSGPKETNPKREGVRPKRATPSDHRVKEFINWFQEEYKREFGQDYIVVSWGKPCGIVKRLLEELGKTAPDPLAKLKSAAKAMFANDWARDKASIELLFGKISDWVRDASASVQVRREPITTMELYGKDGLRDPHRQTQNTNERIEE